MNHLKVARYSYHKNPAKESRANSKPGDDFYAQVAETD
jgi:hypothetical protein